MSKNLDGGQFILFKDRDLPRARFDEARILSILIYREGLYFKKSRVEILPVDKKRSTVLNALWVLLNGNVVVLLTF